jgi:polyisoprenoid-binding protein YceI
MKIAISGIMLLVLMAFSASAQRYITKTGFIRFHSDSPLEKIEAVNRQVNSALDITTGDFVFKVLMKSFTFEKALMQEHFNENYVESDKFPNADFKGKITNLSSISLKNDGTYNATVEGKLTIHGVTKEVKQTGTFEVGGGKIKGTSKFNILLSDYNISIPAAVGKNISNTVEITVDIVLDKLQ